MALPDSAETEVGYAHLVKVDTTSRVSIPVPLLGQMGWWKNEAMDVVAELAAPGIIRVTSAKLAEPLIAELLETAHPDTDGDHDRLMALRDKFRRLRLYKDGRLRLTQEVALLLRVAAAGDSHLLAQISHRSLEIMAPPFWEDRLLRNGQETIGMHLAEASGS